MAERQTEVKRKYLVRVTIGWKIPGLNKWERYHWRKQRKVKKELADMIGLMYDSECRKRGIPVARPAPNCRVTYISHRFQLLTDDDNWLASFKPLNDALVRAKIIKDDCEFIDSYVPDLVVKGIVLAYKKYIEEKMEQVI